MIDFDDIDTLDNTLAEEGVWRPVKRGDKVLMECKLRFVDPLTQKGDLTYKRARAPFAKQIKANTLTDIDLAIIALAFVNIVDWRGVTAGGKVFDFEPKTAFEFFRKDSNRWMALHFLNEANDPSNFIKDEEFDVEGVTGN